MAKTCEKTILVVDDEPNVRHYLRMILEDAGFQVKTARDGNEAWDMIRAHPPDFISLDLVMPKRSGRKLLYDLKKDKNYSRIPILIVTAHAKDEMGEDDLEHLMENRAMLAPNGYLEKPIKPTAYVDAVCRALDIETAPSENERSSLKDALQAKLSDATAAELREALAALRQKRT